MEQAENRLGLIRTRRGAVIALCLTGYVAALSVRLAVSHSQYQSRWLHDLDYFLPSWAGAAVILAFYAWALGLMAMIYRGVPSKERVIVAGWFIGLLMGLVQHLVSIPAASTIQYFRAGGYVMAFLAAVSILFQTPPTNHVQETVNAHPRDAASENEERHSSSIEFTVVHSPLAFIYRFFTPTVEINGTKERRAWGVHLFKVPPGDYEVSASYPWLFSAECGKNTARFHLESGQTKRVKYRAGLTRYLPGKITVS